MKILIVDDEKVMRSLFADLLTEQGYTVVAVQNGREAVEKVRELDFTLAFIDVHMPIMNGVEALKIIKKIKPKTKVVMMDSFPDALVEEAQRAGAVTCIHKPFEIKEVLNIIDEITKSEVKR